MWYNKHVVFLRTIYIPGYKHGLSVEGLCVECLIQVASTLKPYGQKYLTFLLCLSFWYKPVWSSGPNMYMSLEKEGIGGKAPVCFVIKLSLWHLLII